MILAFVTCAWLAVCAVFDLKWREVPPILTLPCLFAAVLWNALNGQFTLAVFVVLLFILADVPVRSRGFANGLQMGIFFLGLSTSPEPVQTVLSMFATAVIWAIWNLEKMGGADAQVLMTLSLFFAPAILLPIALVGGIQGLAALLMRQKKLPFMVSVFAGTCIYILIQPVSF